MTRLYSSGLSPSSSSLVRRWTAPAATAALWALAVASAVFWLLRLSAPADALLPPAATTRRVASADSSAVARLLGAVATAKTVVATAEATSRFALLGVVAAGTRHGAALISMDGKPARPWRVGAQLGDGYVLQSVAPRAATLGVGTGSAASFTLQLPVREPISLGRVTPASVSGSAIAPAPSMPAATPLPPVMAPAPGVVAPPAPMFVPQGGQVPDAPGQAVQ